MSDDQIGCGDNSCIFSVIRESGGMGTNGGCRCFDALESWIESEKRWNRAEIQKVRRDVMRLAREVARLRGIVPELPPRAHEGGGLPRYGVRWNSPTEPLAIPMVTGYWTPWHLAERVRQSANESLDLAEEGWAYADDYYRRKWDFDSRLTALRAALSPKE